MNRVLVAVGGKWINPEHMVYLEEAEDPLVTKIAFIGNMTLNVCAPMGQVADAINYPDASRTLPGQYGR